MSKLMLKLHSVIQFFRFEWRIGWINNDVCHKLDGTFSVGSSSKC